MSDELESRKLSIEEKRAESEAQARLQELRLKEEELRLRKTEFDRGRHSHFSAAATAAIAAVASVLAAAITSYIGPLATAQDRSKTETALQERKSASDMRLNEERTKGELELKEREQVAALKLQEQRIQAELRLKELEQQSAMRFQEERTKSDMRIKELDQQFQILLKATENRSPKEAAENLVFFVDIGYLPDADGKIRAKAKSGQVPTITSPGLAEAWRRYEGRLGNVTPEDAQRYIGRGYLQITGRANYAAMEKSTGLDLISAPEKLADPAIAAKALAAYFRDRAPRFIAALQANDLAAARRAVNGSLNSLATVNAKYDVYLKALKARHDSATPLSLPGNFPAEWASMHVPLILKELSAAGVEDDALRAYVLATADHESLQGKALVEYGMSKTPQAKATSAQP